ncbi:helix-turn-helix domain-containing protein [Catellatospora chokoriensis]|uniref:Helix-turn-helix domain-containing protein n=1 Tax=Catellatospora chokoriensis TaxID=310353 RepID=A0A8J3NW68_9ACTN|nr:helix-turn-helix domain-containing protein [Catellatospora chokoriensis]GIF94633.1 hypothetical protein Cch02nite_80770 [Catellatospora chokoriensis]
MSYQRHTLPTEPIAPRRVTADPNTGQLLYTPAEAAVILRVTQSWLRKRAAKRLIPCTFLGRLLRFSSADLAAIAEHGHRPPQPAAPRRRRTPPRRTST